MKKLTPTEYTHWYGRTGLKMKVIRKFYGLASLIASSDDKTSNLTYATHEGITAVRAGQVTKVFEAAGLIEDVSQHPLRRNWNLTDFGREFYDFLEGEG